VVNLRLLHIMLVCLDEGLRTSHSFCMLIDAPFGAVAYRDLVLGWSIAKAGGEEGSCADTLFRFTELRQAGEVFLLTITAKRELDHDRIHRLGISPRMCSAHAGPHEPRSDTFGYRLVISREGGIDRLPGVKGLRFYAVAWTAILWKVEFTTSEV
jgi:hypothetical protein